MIETITTIWGAMQPLIAGFTLEKANELFDQYIDDGHSIEELMLEINALFETSGFSKRSGVKRLTCKKRLGIHFVAPACGPVCLPKH